MPKSRGRRHAKSPRRTGPTTSPWQATVLRAGRTLAQPEVRRIEAEVYASGLLGTVWAARGLGDREVVDSWLAELLAYAGRRQTPETAAVVAALDLVLSHPVLQAAMTDWAGDLTADLAWRTGPTPLPQRVTRSRDAWDDTDTWFVEYDDTVLLVLTARSDAGAVLESAVLDHRALALWDEEVEGSQGRLKPRVEVPVTEAVATLLSAQQLTEMTYPPNDNDGYVDTGHLLAARLAAVGVPPRENEWEPLPDARREELAEAFFADLELDLDDDEAAREIADLCLDYGEGYLGDDPLAWSPPAVEQFLLDWVPRKTVLDPEVQRLVPTMTYAFTGWAMVHRGVPRHLAAEAAQVALDVADDFAQLYDETERSPATELAHRLQAAGIDLTDKEAVDREVSAYNAEQLARRIL